MKAHFARKIAAAIVLLTVLPTSIAVAQKPVPPAPDAAKPPAVDTVKAPDSVKAAVAMRESMTQQQLATVQSILNRYMPQLQVLAQKLPAKDVATLRKTNAGSIQSLSAPPSLEAATAKAAGDTKALQQIKAVIEEAQALQNKIDQEVLAVLTPAQQTAYKDAISPAQQHLEKAMAQASAATKAPVAVEYYAPYCFVAGQYASIANYYDWYAYVNAYYNYYYYGTTYGYYAYVDLYYAQLYSWYALREIGGGYFDLYTLGTDFNNFVYYGISDSSTAYNYKYYGRLYAYYDYYYYGTSYAYYAYAYSDVGLYYDYYAYLYAYYCYYS